MPIFYTDTGSITNLTVASLNATGSLLGTSSFATTAQNVLGSITTAATASFITSSGVFGPYGANSVLSASWAPGGGGGTTFSAGNVNNRLITATGTSPELNGETNLTFDGTTLNVTGSVIASVEMQTDTISPVGLGGTPTIDVLSSFLYSGYFTTSVDWNNRELRDSFSTISIDWANRTLTDDMGVLAVNWTSPFIGQERMLFDDTGVDSVGWNSRKLLDNSANVSIDWGDPGSGTARNLIDSSGTVLNWDTSVPAGAWFSGSVAGTASFAKRASTSSYVNTLSQNVIVSGSVDITNGGSLTTFGDITSGGVLKSLARGGDEGGEIFLTGSVTNTTIVGGVNIDVYQNKLRIFEAGGTNRGGYYDITALGTGVSTNLLSGGSGATFNGGTNVNNRIITATGTSPELNGETNLTFDGTTLSITGNVTANSFTGSLQGTATTASYVQQAVSASYAVTASYALNSTPSAGTDFGKVIATTQIMYPFSGF